MKINPVILILVTGITLANIVYYLTPPPQMIIIKNDRYYNADTLEPVEIKGTIKNIGSLSIDGTGEWQGSYTLYQYEPTPYANYIMITTITATLLAQIITIGKTVKPTKPVNN